MQHRSTDPSGRRQKRCEGHSWSLVRARVQTRYNSRDSSWLIKTNRPDVDEAYKDDKKALQEAIPKNADAVYAITVGSEALYRGTLKAPDLLTKINDIKATFPSIKVGTADSWNKYADGTADPLITGGVKLL